MDGSDPEDSGVYVRIPDPDDIDHWMKDHFFSTTETTVSQVTGAFTGYVLGVVGTVVAYPLGYNFGEEFLGGEAGGVFLGVMAFVSLASLGAVNAADLLSGLASKNFRFDDTYPKLAKLGTCFSALLGSIAAIQFAYVTGKHMGGGDLGSVVLAAIGFFVYMVFNMFAVKELTTRACRWHLLRQNNEAAKNWLRLRGIVKGGIQYTLSSNCTAEKARELSAIFDEVAAVRPPFRDDSAGRYAVGNAAHAADPAVGPSTPPGPGFVPAPSRSASASSIMSAPAPQAGLEMTPVPPSAPGSAASSVATNELQYIARMKRFIASIAAGVTEAGVHPEPPGAWGNFFFGSGFFLGILSGFVHYFITVEAFDAFYAWRGIEVSDDQGGDYTNNLRTAIALLAFIGSAALGATKNQARSKELRNVCFENGYQYIQFASERRLRRWISVFGWLCGAAAAVPLTELHYRYVKDNELSGWYYLLMLPTFLAPMCIRSDAFEQLFNRLLNFVRRGAGLVEPGEEADKDRVVSKLGGLWKQVDKLPWGAQKEVCTALLPDTAFNPPAA